MFTIQRAIMLVTLCLTLNPLAAKASTIFATLIEDASDLTSVLVTIDSATGDVTQLGSTGVNMQSMAYDSINNVLYGAGVDPLDSTANFNLYTIDRATGMTTLVGDIGWQFATAMTYDSQRDILFAQVGFNDNYLTEVDRLTGMASQIDANVLGISTSSIEYIPGSEQLFFVNNSGQYGTYNSTDGSFEVIGTGDLSGVTSLGYNLSLEQLIGLSGDGLFAIDIANGTATALIDVPTGFYGSMAIVSVPIPGAFLLFISGLGFCGFSARSCRNKKQLFKVLS